MNPYIQVVAAFFGSLGFALLFNLRGRWLFFTALGGGLSWCIYLISGSFISHYERQYFDDDSIYIVSGHTPTKLISGKWEIYHSHNNIVIDCGAAFGGRLACLRLEDMAEFYV